ncbi:5-formyltetrahydrofolate cyclo-ligase [Ferrovum sp.]|uniref:5-formyltetrahydrofolate cyclo-ligase n=1 Tax=Ferrovum sp. TaxID=2609467 RepID=UPI002635987A|nr:5-formyltetrahydrofolate cyclo-ligase [Ferrovum sp.]
MDTSHPLHVDKKSLRHWALQQRAQIPPAQRERRSFDLHRLLHDHPRFQAARVLLLYGSMGSEPNTWPLLRATLKQGRSLVLPRIEQDTLTLYRVRDLDTELGPPGLWGLREPLPPLCDPVRPETLDFILVPGLLFDVQGGRLGYGGGYYDRLLSRAPRAWRLALAFREQCVDEVPREPHDLPIHEGLNDAGTFFMTAEHP